MRRELQVKQYNELLEKVERVYDDNVQAMDDVYEKYHDAGGNITEVSYLLDEVEVWIRNITADLQYVKYCFRTLRSIDMEYLEGVEQDLEDFRLLLIDVDDALNEEIG